MAGESETVMSEAFHGLDDVDRERAFGVSFAASARRRGGASVTAHVEQDHTVRLGEGGRDTVPAGMGLRKAVQEHERRPFARDPREDAPHAHLDEARLKALEEIGKFVHGASAEG
jgi:hypothetical protein